MNNEQQELLYKGYGKALLELAFDWLPYTPPTPPLDTIESFINKCKTDDDFAKRWGLKIEERELSLEERTKLAKGKVVFLLASKEDSYNHARIPTKLITITYNNETIESYE